VRGVEVLVEVAERIGVDEVRARAERLRGKNALVDERRVRAAERLGAELQAATGEASETLAVRPEDPTGTKELVVEDRDGAYRRSPAASRCRTCRSAP
jgi:hypothetical protein